MKKRTFTLMNLLFWTISVTSISFSQVHFQSDNEESITRIFESIDSLLTIEEYNSVINFTTTLLGSEERKDFSDFDISNLYLSIGKAK